MRHFLLAGVLLVAVIAGCAGDTTSEESEGSQAQAPSPQTASDAKCERASRELLDAIGTGLEVGGGGELRRGYIVRSGDFEKVYMVAADIQGPGLEGGDDIGVWATNSKQAGGGIIMAVNGVAQEFSDWGDADKTDAAIDQSADGVDQAIACVEG